MDSSLQHSHVSVKVKVQDIQNALATRGMTVQVSGFASMCTLNASDKLFRSLRSLTCPTASLRL